MRWRQKRVREVASIPTEDTVNRQGHKAYSLSDELRLITMLNTLKIQPQFYRSENDQMRELRDLIERIGLKDPYFVCQAIVWSRCMGEGMRSINHLAAALVAPFISGTEYSKRFYSLFDKKNKRGGCIFRTDDMSEIKDAFFALNPKGAGLTSAMRKGFAFALENMDGYQLSKYSKTTIDITNLVHPRSKVSKPTVVIDGKEMKVIDALMNGFTVSADTWEVANSEAGQEVAKAVKAGKITKAEAETILADAKNANWKSLLKDGKLGIMAALRNIRNMMQDPDTEVIDLLCGLITDKEKIRKALILPCHFDLAYDVLEKEFSNFDIKPKVQQALLHGYQTAIPNLTDALPGKTCVVIDCSGSMSSYAVSDGKVAGRHLGWTRDVTTTSCAYKAGLIAATIAKATNADVIKFGTSAYHFSYNKNYNVFALAKGIGTADDGATYPATAFELITKSRKLYDRIIFISDNEVNGKITSASYKQMIHDVGSPYIYCVDLAAYGTTPLAGDKISYFCGYGSSLYEAIAQNEFNPNAVIDKVKSVVI